MSVKGIQEPTEEYLAKVEAWRACRKAKVEPPKELCEYFGLYYGEREDPDPKGREVYVPAEAWEDPQCDVRSGFELEVAKIPPGVTRLRFIGSW